jgi:hypothetical protein
MTRVRTQVYLEREQHQWLRKEAQDRDVSMTELLRRILADYARERRLSPPREVLAGITKLGDSGAADVAVEHDRYLAEIIADEHLR